MSIRNTLIKRTSQSITNSTALVSIGLSFVVAPGQRIKGRAWIPITIGAAGGIQLNFDNSVTFADPNYCLTVTLSNTVAPAISVASLQNNVSPFTNALANAGNHFIVCDFYIKNSDDSSVRADLVAAQNTANATPLVIKEGAFIEYDIF